MKRIVIGRWSLVLGLALGCLAFTSCHRDVVFSRFHPIPSEKWSADSVLHFCYTITDNEPSYRVLFYLRHTERYPYQNMWLFVGDSLHRDTIEFYLADDRGQWLGDRHNGSIEMSVLLEDDKRFAAPGTYQLDFQHGMRDSLLRGVTDVGLEIRKNND